VGFIKRALNELRPVPRVCDLAGKRHQPLSPPTTEKPQLITPGLGPVVSVRVASKEEETSVPDHIVEYHLYPTIITAFIPAELHPSLRLQLYSYTFNLSCNLVCGQPYC